jgi:hypothetical protein
MELSALLLLVARAWGGEDCAGPRERFLTNESRHLFQRGTELSPGADPEKLSFYFL